MNNPQPSFVEWTLGKGVIGMCWKRDSIQYHDFRNDVKRLNGDGIVTNSTWKRIGNKWGFTQEEYPERIQKYAMILAVPIKDEDAQFQGCVSIDLGSDYAQEGDSLDTAEIREIMSQLSSTIYAILKNKELE